MITKEFVIPFFFFLILNWGHFFPHCFERERKGETQTLMWERNINPLPPVPTGTGTRDPTYTDPTCLNPNLQLRHVPWPRTEPITFRFQEDCSEWERTPRCLTCVLRHIGPINCKVFVLLYGYPAFPLNGSWKLFEEYPLERASKTISLSRTHTCPHPSLEAGSVTPICSLGHWATVKMDALLTEPQLLEPVFGGGAECGDRPGFRFVWVQSPCTSVKVSGLINRMKVQGVSKMTVQMIRTQWL